MLSLGELFTLVAYGQLIIEQSEKEPISNDLMEQIFDFMIRDFSKYALELYSKSSSNEKQMDYCLKMIRKPVNDTKRFERVWEQYVFSLKDVYEMDP